VTADAINLGAKTATASSVFRLHATRLTTSASFGLSQASGSVSNSTLRPGDERRLFRLDEDSVSVQASGCVYPEPFGSSETLTIIRAQERGTWAFRRADFGQRPKPYVRGEHGDISVLSI
jgi:hypothetical protein